MYKVWLISIFAGICIELFFRLIRYRDESNSRSPVAKYRPYSNYVTVNEFVAGGEKRWWKYILFRSLPPLIVFVLLTSIYQKYLPNTDTLYPIFLAALVSLLPRDLVQLMKSSVSLSEKIMHVFNVVFVLIVASVVSYVTRVVPVSMFAPSLNGVVDNLWASLFVAILVIFYLDATNQNQTVDPDFEEDNKRANTIVTIYNRIQEKFDIPIREYCQNQKCSVALLYAILIFESMNRPNLIRKIENLIVKLLPVELTVGIAQVKSRKPLTDQESIEIAARELRDSKSVVDIIFDSSEPEYSDLKKIISRYNLDKVYADSIIQILHVLKKYAEKIFKV